ncbi:hypothetical protein RB595_008023 [Gaeumannomyces hyphopodioides]
MVHTSTASSSPAQLQRRDPRSLKMLRLILTTAAAAGIATAASVPASSASDVEVTKGVLTSLELGKRAPGSIHMENWSGATKAGTGINKVSGTVTVPDWRNRDDGWTSGMYLAVRLDGIPGCDKDDAFVAIGHTTNKKGSNGDMLANNFRGRWGWGSDSGGSENVISFPLRVGDRVHMELIALSPTSINGTIKNLNTGQEVYRTMGNQGGFCGQTANWIAATYSSFGKPMPFTEFLGDVTWTGASAATASGGALNLEGAQPMDIDQTWELDPTTGPVQGGLQTDCNIVGASSVTCKRLLPTPPSGSSQ